MIRARRMPGHHPDAVVLLEAMEAELTGHYGPLTIDSTPSATPVDMSPPTGIYVVLYDGEEAVAGGGVKRLGEHLGEIKRMFVVPESRGQGHARRLLGELETAARALGYSRVRLDTGVKQPHAEALYRSAGYREIDNYNDNDFASYWAEKDI